MASCKVSIPKHKLGCLSKQEMHQQKWWHCGYGLATKESWQWNNHSFREEPLLNVFASHDSCMQYKEQCHASTKINIYNQSTNLPRNQIRVAKHLLKHAVITEWIKHALKSKTLLALLRTFYDHTLLYKTLFQMYKVSRARKPCANHCKREIKSIIGAGLRKKSHINGTCVCEMFAYTGCMYGW